MQLEVSVTEFKKLFNQLQSPDELFSLLRLVETRNPLLQESGESFSRISKREDCPLNLQGERGLKNSACLSFPFLIVLNEIAFG